MSNPKPPLSDAHVKARLDEFMEKYPKDAAMNDLKPGTIVKMYSQEWIITRSQKKQRIITLRML